LNNSIEGRTEFDEHIKPCISNISSIIFSKNIYRNDTVILALAKLPRITINYQLISKSNNSEIYDRFLVDAMLYTYYPEDLTSTAEYMISIKEYNKMLTLIEDVTCQSIEQFTDGEFHYVDEGI
jgi:hypothetical protein